MGDYMKNKKNLLPGLILILIIYFIALKIDAFLITKWSLSIETLTIGIVLGIIINNALNIPKTFTSGIHFSLKKILKLGIILLGFKLNFIALASLGTSVLLGIIVYVPIVLILSILLGKLFNINRKLATLIGVGSCICGTSAIVTVSPLIGADEEEAVISVSIISFLGVIGVLTYTAISGFSPLTNTQYGIWSGLSLQGVSHAIAAAFARGNLAGEIGTFVKMARVVMIVPVSIILSIIFQENDGNQKSKIQFPIYVLFFIIAGIINSFIELPNELLAIFIKGSNLFIAMAMISMGLSVHLKTIQKRGKKAIKFGSLLFLLIAISTYLIILFLI